jgi:hypothetical protein
MRYRQLFCFQLIIHQRVIAATVEWRDIIDVTAINAQDAGFAERGKQHGLQATFNKAVVRSTNIPLPSPIPRPAVF